MKKLILFLGILLSGISVLSVQAKGMPALYQTAAQQNDAVEKRLATIQKDCNLTPDQAAKVKSLLTDFQATQAINTQANRDNPDALKEANKKNSYDYNQKLAKVLTPEQMKSLNAADGAWAKEHAAKAK
jgi:Spy/CpxP family protein refolding chaperone